MVTCTARTVVYCKALPKTLWNWWQRDFCVELWSRKQLSSHAPHPAGAGFCIPLPWLRTSLIRIPASLLGLKDFVSLWASTVTRLQCLIVTGYIRQGARTQKSANPQTPYAKQHSQGPSRRRGRKIGRARKSGTCSELKSPGSIRRCILKVSPTRPSRTDLGKNGTNVHAKLMKKKNARPQTLYQELQTRRKDGSRGGGFSQKRVHWLSSSAKWSAPKTSMQATFCKFHWIGMCACIHIHICRQRQLIKSIVFARSYSEPSI